MQEKYGFIYIWYDRKHKRYYIGSHWGSIDDGYDCSSRWMRAARKRRPQDFKRRIIQYIYNRDIILFEEHKWLSLIKDEELGKRYYNLTNHKPEHWSVNPEARLTVGQKISEKLTGRKNPEHAKRMQGRKLSEEHKRKISESGKGRTTSKLSIEKLVERNITKEWTEEERAKISRANKGRKHTDDAKRRMSETHKGHAVSLETRRKISASNKGHSYNKGWIPTEETRKRMSDAALNRPKKIYSFEFFGEIYTINNLKQFCKDNDLDYNIMVKLNNGKYCQSTYRGWSKAL